VNKRIALNDGWEFTRSFTDAFLQPGSPADETVRLPHTCAETPYDYFDESVYQMVCGYRRTLAVPAEWADKCLLLTVGAAGHMAEVFRDGEKLAEHRCGYTAFTVDLTDRALPGREHLLVIKVDSRENLDQPPFGFVIDYMTYGGLYREVWLEVKEPAHISDVFAKPRLVGEGGEVESEVYCTGLSAGADAVRQSLCLDGREVAARTVPLSGLNLMEAFIPVKLEAPEIRAWDLDSPTLYTLTTELLRDGAVLDSHAVRIGFRDIRFAADGFWLNGRKVKLRGLNRHQSYPYVGYAMPRSMQRLDAEILKNELGCNAVRTSHYPQSQHFIDRCDELGLLVFTEIPGWQHIGGEAWKQQALRNTEDMVRQYRNHPSIILWGVRINESADDDALYSATNAAARALDPTRATGGVRCIKKSRLLEDVYTYNDFLHDGAAPGCEKKKAVTPDMGKAYLISEYGGHMYPTKPYDDERHRTEHALRHAAVLDAAAAQEDIAGTFGWCMFDYNTHKDFGSGDRICYHGVLDMFRNPKTAAAVYAAQQETAPVLCVSSAMDLGEQAASVRGRVFVMTNADEVRFYKGGALVRSYTHADSPYPHMKNGPIEIDDFIGDTLARAEAFPPQQAKLVKELLNYTARFGAAHLPPQLMAKAGVLMTRYGMKYEDLYALYGKYIGDWGVRAAEFRFDAVKDGAVVCSVRRGAVTALRLEARPSHTVLRCGATYDVALIRLSVTDERGNAVPYWQGALDVDVDGPLRLIGPARPTLRGGMGGVYLRTLGAPGAATVTLKTEQTEPLSLRFIIKTEE
jgi:beta-galactosidase